MVCPAEFDTGAAKNMMILSVPEGDDKPLKYPLMFTVSDVVLINKMDTKSVFDFDDQAVQERILKLNPQAKIFFISAKRGYGCSVRLAAAASPGLERISTEGEDDG